MPRLTSVVLAFLAILLISCTTEVSLSEKVEAANKDKNLLVTDITFNTHSNIENSEKDNDNVTQILISFNQKITIPGAVPANSQLQSIITSNIPKEQCNWHFVTLTQLSCRLLFPLTPQTEFSVAVQPSFSALGQSVKKEFIAKFKTDLPNFKFEPNGKWNDFPSSISLIESKPYGFFGKVSDIKKAEQEALIDKLVESIRLKTPSGNLESVTVKSHDDSWQKKHSLYFEALEGETETSTQNVREEGEYELILPMGSKLSASSLAIVEDVTLFTFSYRKDLTFLGFYCVSGYNRWTYIPAVVNEYGVLPCRPERVALAFNGVLFENAYGRNSRKPSDLAWLTGGGTTASFFRRFQGRAMHSVSLEGNTQYQLNLEKVVSLEGKKIKRPQTINFKTEHATPIWEFDDTAGTVVENRNKSQSGPVIHRKNVELIKYQSRVITSAEALHAFLNDTVTENRSEGTFKSIEAPTGVENSWFKQPVPFLSELNNSSGLVEVTLSGKSTGWDNAILSEKVQKHILQSADFNVSIWRDHNLFVKVSDWNGDAIMNASVALVCSMSDSVKRLGNTDKHGSLWLEQEELANKLSENCWLWIEKEHQKAASQVPDPSNSAISIIKAQAWSTQPVYLPDDTVFINFISRVRTEHGLKPLSSFDEYSVVLKADGRDAEYALQMDEPTKEGFSSARFDLSSDLNSDVQLGNYSFYIVHTSSGEEKKIGEFYVGEFTPPEFEFDVENRGVAYKGEAPLVNIKARRMNGGRLSNAKATVKYYFSRSYDVPKHWPRGYEFMSWQDYEKNDTSSSQSGVIELDMDSSGQGTATLPVVRSSLPMAKINFDTIVISKSGESQYKGSSARYFSREHYIGTKFNQDTQTLNVVAVDKFGKSVNNLNVLVEVYPRSNEEPAKKDLITSCRLSKLPSSCDLSALNITDTDAPQSYKILLKSDNESGTWYRSINIQSKANTDPESQLLEFEFESLNTELIAGKRAELVLNSDAEGLATFIVQAGTTSSLFYKRLQKGQNNVSFDVTQAWLPYARVYAFLAVGQATIKDKVASLLSAETDEAEVDKNMVKNKLNRQRLLNTSIQIETRSNKPEHELNIALLDNTGIQIIDEVRAGEEIKISITSTLDADAQVWLVNDALLPMLNKQNSSYDFAQDLWRRWGFERSVKITSLSEKLVFDEATLNPPGNNSVQRRNRVPPPPAQAAGLSASFNLPSIDIQDEKNIDMSQSVFIKSQRLIAGEVKTINVQLPSLIGRWKIMVLSAQNDHVRLNDKVLKTVHDIEYSLQAPNNLYENDQAVLSIEQINKTNSAVTDTITLWLGNEPLKSFVVSLRPGEQSTRVIEMPNLAPGLYQFVLVSKRLSSFATQQTVLVKSSEIDSTKRFILDRTQNKIVVPLEAKAQHMILSASPISQMGPDWLGLSNFNKNYTHQCWEQNISRAVLYSNNAYAREMWPEGIAILNTQINSFVNLYAEEGLFSYFPKQNPDLFLGMYTYLVLGWLKNTDIDFPFDESVFSKASERLNQTDSIYTMFNKGANSLNTVKSLFLLAQAENSQIGLQEALIKRQSLGASDPFATVLQALALKKLGADKATYINDIKALSHNSYIDTHQNIFNENSQKCFMAMVYDKTDPEQAALELELLLEQQKNGHFGSTFANAVCSQLFKGKTGIREYQPIDYEVDASKHGEVGGNILSFDLNAALEKEAHAFQNNHQNNGQNNNHNNSFALELRYQNQLTDITQHQQGLSLSKEYFVYTNGEWIKLSDPMLVKVGDIVKVEINLSSPVERSQVSMVDSVPAGFEPINPDYNNQFYRDSRDSGWFASNQLEFRNGQAFTYLKTLTTKPTSLVYFNRVRHSGVFNIGPASAETMYRDDVKANTASKTIRVEP